MRCHDLHGDGRFSLLALARAREERDARKQRRKARKGRSWPRWLTILGKAVRWHFREPDWSKGGHREALPPEPLDTDAEVRQRVQEVLADLDAREVLALARGVAHRDGERQLERVVHAVLLLDLLGALEGVAASCDLVLTQIGREMGREPGERVH